MTEKNIFAYKPFFSLNISDFIFYVKIATPPEKSHPPLSQQPHSKSQGPVKPPFWKFGWRFTPPLPPQCRKGGGGRGGGAHYAFYWLKVKYQYVHHFLQQDV